MGWSCLATSARVDMVGDEGEREEVVVVGDEGGREEWCPQESSSLEQWERSRWKRRERKKARLCGEPS